MSIGNRLRVRPDYQFGTAGFVILLLLLVSPGNGSLAQERETPPSGAYDDRESIQCHLQKNAPLISAWQHGAHGRKQRSASCTACHGKTHHGGLERAHQDDTCIDCHGGPKAPVTHSYATSKHGLILRLEAPQQGWSRPLQDARYRTPGCAYCHMHRGQHDVSKGVRKDILDDTDRQAVQDEIHQVCQDCHSPRYVGRLFDNGEKMLEVGRSKLREAMQIVEQASVRFGEKDLVTVHRQLKTMRHHLKNIYLGVAHQSPDYQWWHGQPAMDGDLLRIKGQLDELQRIQTISAQGTDERAGKTNLAGQHGQ